jgi:hypothetical protein
MSATVVAALEVNGPVIRYAEIERDAEALTISRLGQQTLDFDVKAHALEADDEEAASTVAATLSAAFPDARAERATVVIHPSEVCAFFTPVPSDVSGAERKRQVVRQVALLSGARSLEGLHVRAQLVRRGVTEATKTKEGEGDAPRWLHVLLVPDAVHDRMGRILQPLPVTDYDWMLSTEAAARLTAHAAPTARREEGAGSFAVAVGQYAEHTEYAVVQDDEWVHDHHSRAVDTMQDRLYHLVALLNRLQIPLRRVNRLWLYGHADPNAYEVFESVFQVTAEHLDPSAVPGWPESMDRSLGGLFVPCVGAAR